MNETEYHLRDFRRRLALLRMSIHGAVVKQPQAAIEFGLILGEVESLIASTQAALVSLSPGAHIPMAGLLEEGPGADDVIN